MTQEEKLKEAKRLYKTANSDQRYVLESLFPELKESEDEKIRREITTYLSTVDDKELIPYESWIAWIKKQVKQKPIERKEFTSIPFGAFDSELIEQMFTIPDGCVATIEGNKIHIKRQYKTATEAIKEEKVDNVNKVESKFHEGDWVVRKDDGVFFNDRKFAQITEIDGEKHWFDTGLICLKAEDMRLWTLEDAKDGDILYSKKHNLLWRYKNTKECYCCINLNYNSNNISIGGVMVIPNDVRPATKKQCDLLFDKILQHTFSKINANKVEPKFKAGDWLQYRNAKPFYVEGITSQGYVNGISCLPFSWEDEIHLWSIADAQAGDVLVASDGSIFIFAGVVDCACKYYITLTATNDVKINKEKKGGYWETSRAVYPATKEQRDLLFQKMKESGWGFDFEKKELKKIMEK